MDIAEPISTPIDYSDSAPLLIAASNERAMRRARSVLDGSGLRLGAALPITGAAERVRQQAALSLLWVEVDEDGGADLDALLAQARRDAEDGRCAAVVSTSTAMLDPVVAGLDEAAVEILVDPTPAERVSAIALALSRVERPTRLSDIAADRSAEQLRQLSEEVNRIATMLARLSAGPEMSPRAILPEPDSEVPPVSIDTVRKVIRARRLRARFFPEDLFADPAWDMLLDLLQAELAHLRVPVSSLCIAAAVPATTALRWLKTMVAEGLFLRRSDPHDGRRVFVELAPDARNALHRYFAELERVAVV